MKPRRTKEELVDYQAQSRKDRATVQSHADADYASGRKWECACALCSKYREDGFKPSQERTPLRVF
jgi:hypothetical protein